ncbi:MAG: sigma-70 family RNA polymerase sigma factor [Anaerolineae bacterium]|nr:sigma-70 family RNA polymerase sigma factor [Anaerolineae bacterium]
MNEEDLIRSAAAGDLDAFNQLVLNYEQMAYNLANRILNDSDAAADATQSAFISAYQSIGKFRGGSFKAWLLRIVSNACIDELRSRKRRPVTRLEPVDHTSDEEIESPLWMADDALSPEEQLDQSELWHAIEICLARLSEDYRLVVTLVDINGCDYQEVSIIVGKPLGTIKSRLARARERMQACLQGFWELIPDKYRHQDKAMP